MAKEQKAYGHPELVGGGETAKHSHAGGGSLNVKSGTVATSGESGSVTFNTAFSSTPRVVLTPQDASVQERDCLFVIRSVSTTGFSFEVDADTTYAWIATDAGDP